MALGMLHPQSFLCPLEQSVTDLAAGNTDVFEIPVAEMAQRDKRCLALAMRDRGGNQPVDEAAEARRRPSSESWSGHREGEVLLSIVMAISFERAGAPPASLYACCWQLKL
jgi:adenine-specific DNA glycosylase